MRLEELQAAEQKLLLPTYERNPLLVTGGEGVFLQAEHGVRYLDLLSGIGVSALGYAHPVITAAIQAASASVLHTSNLFFHEGQAALALRLTEASGLNRAFFCNSGTEAWEAALKMARLYGTMRRGEGAALGTRFLAMEGSFHGRTMGSVATTHKEKYREPFAPVMPEVDYIPFNDVAALEAAWSNEYCALLIEPIQGEGGIRPVSQAFMDAARAVTQRTGGLLVADEIQAGFGRTGKWFAFQHYDVAPDIITVAKPLAGGLPLGAMLCTDEVGRAMQPGLHGTTFGGGPLACRVAVAVFDEIERSALLAHVTEVGAYFEQRLAELKQRHPQIVDVRGKGLMLAIELSDALDAKAVLEQMINTHHVLINRTSETVLRFLPPYILKAEHVDLGIAALDASLRHLNEKQLQAAAQTGGTIGD
ncbi:aspartate aminotransferase family protein [Acidipila sp. EB88]|uniref:aspartate aminotransferase family protein n=1 Tax=Acidipila sp. EB88 TaxID=2305226 RepID=UPI000F5D7E54|nr:acetylornithine/succinylornithine family transaminase [Acidipila sp. EB88]RRA49747.1 acetylornithine/succinylornithine family transaminase [Acidipila sp. EB88]